MSARPKAPTPKEISQAFHSQSKEPTFPVELTMLEVGGLVMLIQHAAHSMVDRDDDDGSITDYLVFMAGIADKLNAVGLPPKKANARGRGQSVGRLSRSSKRRTRPR